jgi:hypothetical protein
MEIDRHRTVRGHRREARQTVPPSPEEASVVAKAMVDALADILRSERS